MAGKSRISTKAAKAAPTSAPKDGARRVFNVAQLDAKNPIPLEYNGNWYTTRKGTRYIPFLNPSDNFPKTLLEARLLSPTAFNCIGTKVHYCIGKGWYIKDGKEDEQLKEWAKCLNKEGETLNDILASSFDHFLTMGNVWGNVIRGQVGSTKFVKIVLREFLDCRLLMPEDEEVPTHVAITKDFRKEGIVSLKTDAYVEVPLYTADKLTRTWYKDDKGDEHLMIHVKNKIAGYEYYGMPSRIAGVPHEILEYKAARHNIDEFDNNLVVGGILMLDSNLTQEEADALGKKIIAQHTGDGKKGRIMILAGMDIGDGSNSKYVPFEKQLDGDFIGLDTHTEDKIVMTNEWDATLAGLKRDKGLGNGGNAYIRSIFDIKNETVIKPLQDKIIEKLLMPVLELCDEWLGTKWSDLDLGIRTTAPVSFAGDVDVNSIITVDEGRDVLGLQKLEGDKGKELIKPGAAKSINLFPNSKQSGDV